MSENTLLGIGSRVRHPAYGDGVIIALDVIAYEVCFTQHGLKTIGKNYENWEIIEAIPTKDAVSFNEVEEALAKILRKWLGTSENVELGDKWVDGMLILKPGEADLKPKEIPIDTFFHKIIMVRDRIRVMEQRINSSNLSDEEKINLHQYITRIYGSLTTFNVLFKYKDDHFIGEKTR